MGRRLVIPAGAKPADVAFRDRTWQNVADEARVDAIETLGSAWCTANFVVGLGVSHDYVPPPPPPVDADPVPVISPAAVQFARANTAAALTALNDSVDPAVANPADRQRIAALEILLVRVIKRLEARAL